MWNSSLSYRCNCSVTEYQSSAHLYTHAWVINYLCAPNTPSVVTCTGELMNWFNSAKTWNNVFEIIATFTIKCLTNWCRSFLREHFGLSWRVSPGISYRDYTICFSVLIIIQGSGGEKLSCTFNKFSYGSCCIIDQNVCRKGACR